MSSLTFTLKTSPHPRPPPKGKGDVRKEIAIHFATAAESQQASLAHALSRRFRRLWKLTTGGTTDGIPVTSRRHTRFDAALSTCACFNLLAPKTSPISYLLCSAAQLAVALRKAMADFRGHTNSPDYQRRREISQRKTVERETLKEHAHAARRALVKAQNLQRNIFINRCKWEQLSYEDQGSSLGCLLSAGGAVYGRAPARSLRGLIVPLACALVGWCTMLL